ncbi:MAG TPA: immunoglobulin domain-containing protein [Verrucomicrobiae bacterium]|nr:immunoglobulin domain-containing protein [Verrucomicrobiae bacterium]
MNKSLLFSIVLAAASMPLLAQPTITQQPTNQTLALGGMLTLSVTTSDPLAAYQWFQNNRLILGATNSTLTVTNAGAADTGTYFVVATNGSGMVISVPALAAVGSPTLMA